jgi:type IV secretory pathway TrbL component
MGQKNSRRFLMKRLIGFLISGALIVGSAGPVAVAQQPDKNKGVTGAVKDVGKGTEKAAKTTGKAVEKTTKKSVDTTKKGVKKAAKGTKKGAEKVGETVNPKNW